MKVNTRRLKKADPEGYAILCERAGYKEEALKYYQTTKGENTLYHAAELAIELGKIKLARELVEKVVQESDRSLGISRGIAHEASFDPEGRGMLGAAMGYLSAQDRHKEMQSKIANLEAILREKENDQRIH